jgi:3-oxoacyl-[acyl-carrier-protein] synthase II
MRRVVITGIGIASCLGVGTEETWQGLLAGASGIRRISAFDPTGLQTELGAEIDGFDAKPFVENRRALRNMTRNDQLAVVGAALAAQDAGFAGADGSAEVAALYLGGNKETSHPDRMVDAALAARAEDGSVDMATMGTEGAKRFYPLFYVEGLQAAALFYISQAYGMQGANTYFHGTADAGATAIGQAQRAVRRGEAEIAIAGGFDDATSWWSMAKMDGLGVLSRRNDLGDAACRPYSADRDGTVLGEGAAFVVLEEAQRAAERGATVYAEVAGVGAGFDSAGLLTPAPDGEGVVHALRAALRDAGAAPGDVGYIAAHGCGTRRGDASEAAAIRAVFGDEPPMASSVKPATGHLVAGAGALNVAVAALALHHGVVPPTRNLDEVDPACAGVDWVPAGAREAEVDVALAIARGLEGQDVVLAMRRPAA